MKLLRGQSLHLGAGAAVLMLALAAAPGQAQEWPARPITMVIPTAAGGGADILGRILAGRLSEILGQPVIAENIGNAVASTNRVAKGPPDGNLFHFGNTAHYAYHPTLYKKPVYNPRTEFAPVALLAEQPFLLVARNDMPVSNLREFMNYVKANQDKSNSGPARGPAPAITSSAKWPTPPWV
jgi:tripartite-type tricarboxylate transporter receptor subunit TctC